MYKYCTSTNYYNSSVSYRMKILMQVQGVLFCPISPKSDQHLFSPNNIITSSREKFMRINKIITSGKIHVLWSSIKFSQLILEGSVWRSVWRICIWILESKKLRQSNWFNGHTVYTVYSKNRNTVTWLSGWDASLPHLHFVATVRFSMVIMMPNTLQFLTLLFLILLTKDECKVNSNHTLTLWRSFYFLL